MDKILKLKRCSAKELEIKELGPLCSLLGIEVIRSTKEFCYLNRSKQWIYQRKPVC